MSFNEKLNWPQGTTILSLLSLDGHTTVGLSSANTITAAEHCNTALRAVIGVASCEFSGYGSELLMTGNSGYKESGMRQL